MLAEHDLLAREVTARNESNEAYLLRLTEVEVTTRTATVIAARIRLATFPVMKELDTFDFTATPSVPKQTVRGLARGERIERRTNCCLIGGSGTGKTHRATSIGLSLGRLGKKVRFVTAAGLVRSIADTVCAPPERKKVVAGPPSGDISK